MFDLNSFLSHYVSENNFDRVIVDAMSPTQREYNIPSGRGVWKNQLIEQFPEEQKAIETFFSMVNKVTRQTKAWVMVKVIPIWLVKLISLFGLPRFLSDFYALGGRTLKDVIEVRINLRLLSCNHISLSFSFLSRVELNQEQGSTASVRLQLGNLWRYNNLLYKN